MMAGKFDPQDFFGRADTVAALVPAGEIFGLFTRSIDLPPQWAALVRRKSGRDDVVTAGGLVAGEDADDVLFLRAAAIDVVLDEEGIATCDHFQCRAQVRMRLRAIVERGEMRSFQETILGSHRFVTAADVARHLQSALRAALTRLAAERNADDLVDGGAASAVSVALAEAAKGICFSSGLALDAAPSAQFASQAFGQVRHEREEAARRRATHEASRELEQALERAQTQHLDHLTSLLERLKDLSGASPDAALPDLVKTFSEQQRGEIYEALFASQPAASKTRWVVVAAGDELMFFDSERLAEPSRRLPISGSAGAARSIQTVNDERGSPILLLGAATGVYRLPIGAARPDVTLLVESAPPVRGGFNAATVVGDRVFASHSELGLCVWTVHEPRSVRFRFTSMTRGAKAVRGVRFFDGDLYVSIDDRIVRWRADDAEDSPTHVYTGSVSTITALCPTAEGLFAGNSEGEVLHWAQGRETAPKRLHAGSKRPVESLWLLASHGVRRLVFTDTSLYVYARVLGDNFTCRYETAGQTLRRVAVAPDLIVATNDLRDRLICWTSGDPAKPMATLGVARICGHSVQDLCLVPQA